MIVEVRVKPPSWRTLANAVAIDHMSSHQAGREAHRDQSPSIALNVVLRAYRGVTERSWQHVRPLIVVRACISIRLQDRNIIDDKSYTVLS